MLLRAKGGGNHYLRSCQRRKASLLLRFRASMIRYAMSSRSCEALRLHKRLPRVLPANAARFPTRRGFHVDPPRTHYTHNHPQQPPTGKAVRTRKTVDTTDLTQLNAQLNSSLSSLHAYSRRSTRHRYRSTASSEWTSPVFQYVAPTHDSRLLIHDRFHTH